MNWQVSPPLRYVDRHKCTINFEIIYNFVVKRKNRCFMLKFFHHPVPSEPETVSDWLRSTDNEQASFLSVLT